MGVSSDPSAYAEFYELMDRALASERGIQVLYRTEADARTLQQRLNRARQFDRAKNAAIFAGDREHPMYNTTQYSSLSFKVSRDIDRDRWIVRLEKVGINDMEIEDIPAPEPEVVDLDGDNIEALG